MIKTNALLAGAAALVAVMGAAVTAEAKGKHHGFHKFHRHHHVFIGQRHRDFGGYGYGYRHGCGYYKRMWWRTGDPFWKYKYFDCID